MDNSGEPLTEGAFGVALAAAGLHLPAADLPAALAGALRLRAQVAELVSYLAVQSGLEGQA